MTAHRPDAHDQQTAGEKKGKRRKNAVRTPRNPISQLGKNPTALLIAQAYIDGMGAATRARNASEMPTLAEIGRYALHKAAQ